MTKETLALLLDEYKSGHITLEQAVSHISAMPYEDIGYARIDHHRSLRTGYPEVIFCQGKTVMQITEIFKRLSEKHVDIMATRAEPAHFEAIKEIIPNAEFDETARIVYLKRSTKTENKGLISVITAGTADIPVASEAATTAWLMGNKVQRIFDVGVAGIHRLFSHLEVINQSNVLVVVAGMEGALASVVAGLVSRPVIAVPTSIGYGASFGGLSALLTMINSCANGIATVNIDNGFGAGYMAALINSNNGGNDF